MDHAKEKCLIYWNSRTKLLHFRQMFCANENVWDGFIWIFPTDTIQSLASVHPCRFF